MFMAQNRFQSPILNDIWSFLRAPIIITLGIIVIFCFKSCNSVMGWAVDADQRGAVSLLAVEVFITVFGCWVCVMKMRHASSLFGGFIWFCLFWFWMGNGMAFIIPTSGNIHKSTTSQPVSAVSTAVSE